MDGHSGPKAIRSGRVPRLASRSVRNGAGALYDFECYGANLMTWMMDNQAMAVTATTQRFQPGPIRGG